MESTRDWEQSSESIQPIEEMESSQEKEKQINSWSRIQEEVCNRHQAELEALIKEFEENGEWTEVANIKAANALLRRYTGRNLEKYIIGVFTVIARDEGRFDVS